ncbi:unnamed protein product, partial [Lymnaea stagnalis]
TFDLDQISGKITLKTRLDYEKRSFYHLKIFSRDEGSPSCPSPQCLCNATEVCKAEPVDLFITILDVEDTAPVFEGLPYIETVSEDKPEGFPILRVIASDGDRGVAVPNNVYFSISGGDIGLFSINSLNGTISVGKALDADTDEVRNRGGFYLINVTATEAPVNSSAVLNQSTSVSITQVSITILDVDDNLPTFNQTEYNATVPENTPLGVPLSVTPIIFVEDKDQGINSRFNLSVTKDGLPYKDFLTLPAEGQTIQGRSSITITVGNSSVLDFETRTNITFQADIVATSIDQAGRAKNSTSATIFLKIDDTNDNSPTFPTQSNSFNVSENATVGDLIATIKAEDVDTKDYGKVTYSLEESGFDGEFLINNTTGELRVAKSLDREQRSSYMLVVDATDSPSLPEDQRRRSRFSIGVHIMDVNDNSPVWAQVIPFITVLESTAVNTTMTELWATDSDEGLNGEIVYSIAPGTNGSDLFAVGQNNGRGFVNVRQTLIDHFGLRLVIVTATDKGVPSKNSSTNLSVFVVDENQHRPVFTKPNEKNYDSIAGIFPDIEILEEQNIGSNLFQFQAQDADSGENGRVNFFLLATTNKDYEYFKIDRATGNLTSVGRLDREVKDVYEIQVNAEDNGQPAPLSNTMTLRVRLKDVDDNLPIYNVTMPQKMQVKEEVSPIIIGQVTPAGDKDLPPFNTTCYFLYGGDNLTSFQLNSTSGELSLRDKLDRETTQFLNLVIKAAPPTTPSSGCQQTGLPAKSQVTSSKVTSDLTPPTLYNSSDTSLLWLQVVVVDINDNPPKFTSPDLPTAVLNDADIGTEVMTLTNSVTDADTPINSQHKFDLLSVTPKLKEGSVLDTDKTAFIITENGTIQTNIRFRSDLDGSFLLSIKVYDKDGLNDITVVEVYLISNPLRMILVFDKQPNEVETVKNQLIKELSDIVNLDLVIDRVVTHSLPDGTRDPKKTDAYIHGREKVTGTIIPAGELWSRFNYDQTARTLLATYGVIELQSIKAQVEDNSEENLKRAFAIVGAILAVIVVALCLVLVHIVRLYRHRLLAATTMAYASPKEQEMYEHPGTNKYFAA